MPEHAFGSPPPRILLKVRCRGAFWPARLAAAAPPDPVGAGMPPTAVASYLSVWSVPSRYHYRQESSLSAQGGASGARPRTWRVRSPRSPPRNRGPGPPVARGREVSRCPRYHPISTIYLVWLPRRTSIVTGSAVPVAAQAATHTRPTHRPQRHTGQHSWKTPRSQAAQRIHPALLPR